METVWNQTDSICKRNCLGCPLFEQDAAVVWATKGLVKAIENWRDDLFDSQDSTEVRQAIEDEISIENETNRRRFTPEVQDLAAAVILHNCTTRTKRRNMKKETING